nr:reverse transcriptase domain-containing protein [Tanacetum cinerariifolium]
MADRTMEELLQAPTEGYGEAIVILKILAENFEIKTNLLQLVQTNKFYGFKRDNPHTHITVNSRSTNHLVPRVLLEPSICQTTYRTSYLSVRKEASLPHGSIPLDSRHNVASGQPLPDHRSMVVICGGKRRSTMVNGRQRRWTTVDHRRTTGQRCATLADWVPHVHIAATSAARVAKGIYNPPAYNRTRDLVFVGIE